MNKSHELSIVEVSDTTGSIWKKSIDIYNKSFPDWEKEKETIIIDRVKSGQYIMRAALINQVVVGLYILDVNEDCNYALFSYLAIDESVRGRGYGTLMCKNAMNFFKENVSAELFMIEAEDRQAILYGQLGFKKIEVEYMVPEFNGSGSVPMHLMVHPKNGEIVSLDGKTLSSIIKNIFINGYFLKESDQRFIKQIDQVKYKQPVVKWP